MRADHGSSAILTTRTTLPSYVDALQITDGAGARQSRCPSDDWAELTWLVASGQAAPDRICSGSSQAGLGSYRSPKQDACGSSDPEGMSVIHCLCCATAQTGGASGCAVAPVCLIVTEQDRWTIGKGAMLHRQRGRGDRGMSTAVRSWLTMADLKDPSNRYPVKAPMTDK